ncbi:hypothetical protein Bpro_4975 (plasmid) [Polaromonas sp. JS666]|nr:hypothetical protein Bpro_4975 [Polaromonas sp. JS666]
MAGCGCSNPRNRRHIADTQPVDINVGYGASSLNKPMSAVSLKQPSAFQRLLPIVGVGLPATQLISSQTVVHNRLLTRQSGSRCPINQHHKADVRIIALMGNWQSLHCPPE